MQFFPVNAFAQAIQRLFARTAGVSPAMSAKREKVLAKRTSRGVRACGALQAGRRGPGGSALRLRPFAFLA